MTREVYEGGVRSPQPSERTFRAPSAGDMALQKTASGTFIPEAASVGTDVPVPSQDERNRANHALGSFGDAEMSMGRTGWQATLRTASGGPVVGEPKLTDTFEIDYGGRPLRMTLQAGLEQGILRDNGDGSIALASDTDGEDREGDRKGPRLEADPDIPHMAEVDPKANHAMVGLASLSEATGVEVHDAVLSYMETGRLPRPMEAHAFKSGDNPAQLQEMAEAARAGFQGQAEAVLKKNGVYDTEQFWSWVEATGRQGTLKRAVLGLVFDQTDVLKHMASDYKQTSRVDHARHGLEVITRKDSRGNPTEYVRWPNGQTMSARMARQQGYI